MSVSLSSATQAKVQRFVKDGQLPLSSGAIKRAFENDGTLTEPAILQLTNFKLTEENAAPGTCARAKLFDGAHYYKYFFFASSLVGQIKKEAILGKADRPGTGGEILLITKTHFSLANKTKTGSVVFVIDEYELLARGLPPMDNQGTEHLGTPQHVESFRNFKPSDTCFVPWAGTGDGGAPAPSASAPAAMRAPPPVRQPASFGGGHNVTPITAITPYVNKWRICGVCTAKEDLKDINTKNGASKVFNFELTDKNGDTIRIAGFGETAEKAHGLVQPDCSYYLAGGSVRQTNKRFNTTGHDYEITLRHDSEITPCNDQHIQPPAFTLKVCPLDRVMQHKDETVDVLAVVDKLEPVNDFTSRAGKQMTKRDIALVDQTGTIINFTLWNDQARQFEDQALGQVIGIKGANVKEWNGGFSLGAISGTKWELSPQMAEVASLYEWYRDERPNAETKTLAPSMSGGGDSLSRDLRMVGAFTALQLGNEPDMPNGRYMSVKARINTIKQETALYQACSNEGCQKKVVQLDSQFRCEKCNTTSDTFKWHYMVAMELADCTGAFWVTAFEKAAEKLFGKSAQQMGELKEMDNEAYQKVLDDARSKNYMWRIRAKPETYNEEMRIRYSVYDAQEVNWDKYISELEKTLSALEAAFP